MTALHLISDANLISARLYGIGLDIEEACALLACQAGRRGMPARRDPDGDHRVQQASDMLRAILLHLWPEPDDPAVAQLRASARTGLEHAALLTAGIAHQ